MCLEIIEQFLRRMSTSGQCCVPTCFLATNPLIFGAHHVRRMAGPEQSKRKLLGMNSAEWRITRRVWNRGRRATIDTEGHLSLE